MLVGYARVSTLDQNASLQTDALEFAGCKRIFVEKASGSRAQYRGEKATVILNGLPITGMVRSVMEVPSSNLTRWIVSVVPKQGIAAWPLRRFALACRPVRSGVRTRGFILTTMIDEGRRQKNLALISSPSHQAHWCEALVADGLPLLPEAAAKPPRRRRKTDQPL